MFAQVLGRALRLRCPVCGHGRMFRGWMTMNRRCDSCGLWYERGAGYFLGSIYINYALTTAIATAAYLAPMLWSGKTEKRLLIPVVLFSVLFPLYFFRYARSIWLALDHCLSPLDPEERPDREA